MVKSVIMPGHKKKSYEKIHRVSESRISYVVFYHADLNVRMLQPS